MNKMKSEIEQTFDVITLGSLPGECIKDGFDESLRNYIQSEEYVIAKQQKRRGLAYLESLLNDSQKKALHSFLDTATNSNSMLLSEAYMHGAVESIALRKKVITE